MHETAAHLVDYVVPKVPVRQWVLSFPISLRILFAVHPELLLPVLQIIHRAIATFHFKQTGQKRDQAATVAATLIQRFGSAASVYYTENWAAGSSDGTWPEAEIATTETLAQTGTNSFQSTGGFLPGAFPETATYVPSAPRSIISNKSKTASNVNW